MNILVVSFTSSHTYSQNAGNNKHILNITSYLQNLGHKIYFLYINSNNEKFDLKKMEDKWDYVQVVKTDDMWSRDLDKFKMDFAYDDIIGEEANKIHAKFSIDMCICHYFVYSKVLDALPNYIIKVIDTHDVFTNRFKYLENNLIQKEFLSLTEELEKNYLNRADILLARTEEDKNFFNKITNTNKSIVLTYCDIDSKFINRTYNKLNLIGFVGAHNKINMYCILSFLNEFDKWYKKGYFKNIKIEIVGEVLKYEDKINDMFSFASKLRIFLNNFNLRTFFNIFKPNLAKKFFKVFSKRDYFINTGFLKNLDEFYNRVDLVILPILVGTGVNIKTAEALSKGIPVVSTINGFKGFVSNHKEHNSTEIKQMLSNIKTIHKKPLILNKLSEISKEIYLQYLKCFKKNVDVLLNYEKSLNFPKFVNNKVSIVIPIYNNLSLIYNCLKAILKNTNDIPYEVIIVDDASTDSVSLLHKYVKNIKIIKNPVNLGYLKSCNLGSESATGEFILLLNNDTLVHKDWLKYILKTFEIKKDAGIVGGKLLNSDGSIQEAGAYISSNGVIDLIHTDNSSLYSCDYLRPVDYLSGACLCIPRKLFFEVGKLDEIYGFGYSEDPDLCMKIRELGYEVYYQPKAQITHLGSKTFGKSRKALIKKNNKILFTRWKEQFYKNHSIVSSYNHHPSELFLVRNRSKHKKTILCFDELIPSYFHGGGRSSFNYLETFVKMGLNVKFFPRNIDKKDAQILDNLQQMGIEVIYPASELKPFLEINGKFIDYIFLQRPFTYDYINDLKKFTRAKILYYGHDLHFLRQERFLKYENKSKITKSVQKLKDIELTLINIADVAFYPTEAEIKILNEVCPLSNVKLLTPFMYDTKNSNFLGNNLNKVEKNVLLVASTHTPNVDGLKWFIKHVWKEVLLKTHGTARFNVVGNIKSVISCKEVLKLASDNINFLGEISNTELENIYKTSKVAICPTLYGAGLSSKITEAIYYGVPVVTTNLGAEGLPKCYNELVYTAENESDFVKLIMNIFDDNYVYNKNKAIQYICENFSQEKVMKQLEDAIYN